jgi:hypothetical protein
MCCKVGNWSSHFTQECLAPIIEATQAVKPPNYQTVLELDRKIREFSVPVLPESSYSDHATMERRSFGRSGYKELSACGGALTHSYCLTLSVKRSCSCTGGSLHRLWESFLRIHSEVL